MKLTFKVYLFLFVFVFSCISIFSLPPLFLEKGVIVNFLDKNSSLYEQGLRPGSIIIEVNGKKINSLEEFNIEIFSLNNSKIEIKTKDSTIVGIFSYEDFKKGTFSDLPKTRIKTGLDIQGGARALVKADVSLSDQQLDDLIAVSQQRFNVYGLTDVSIRKVSDFDGNNFMLVEIAGSSPSDLEELIAKQGKFEAKIGNETVFIGGNEDITYVGRTGKDSGIRECFKSGNLEVCNFAFSISLSEKAAARFAEVTKNLEINTSSGGRYLSKTIDFYLDDQLTDSLSIAADLRGRETTQVQISGSGSGTTREEAYKESEKQMKKLQTVLITGSLPFKLEIVKIDRISPRLGNDFLKQILIAGFFAFLAVGIIVFVKYRNIKSSILVIFFLLAEIIIILGVAALINWNLDLPSIAGILATIGTGVDAMIVILDEAKIREETIKEKIKKALFIIISSFSTTAVALLPLTGALSFIGIGAVSAGLLKGFAITTIIGISTGVLITRPAFSDLVRKMEE
ncbi:MAG: hypothetical protein QW103_00075 [Candidatus Pacearchaeota archaeon]